MNHYVRERFVGRGACGSAFVCRRLKDSKRVVIKEIAIEMNEVDREATLNEIKVLSMLHHPNIIEYCDSFAHEKSMMIVMEFAAGGTLFDLIEARVEEKMSYLDEDEIGHLFAQIALPVHHIHSKNILHRDLKSKNIFLTATLDHAKIGDFGISKILTSKSKAYTVVGTPSYISPELCEGRPYNYKSDVWSLGCLLYEMCSLKRAFEAPNLPALVMKIMRGTVDPLPKQYSKGLQEILALTLALDPRDRPDMESLLSHYWLAPHVMRLPTCVGVIPCTSGPPRPLSAADAKDLKISMHDFTVKSRQKTMFASRKTTILFAADVNQNNEVSTKQIKLCDPDASDLSQISLGYDDVNHVYGVTQSGKVLTCKLDSNLPKIKFLSHLVSFRVIKVSCGDGFQALLTDRCILLTMGLGTTGCLGHGNEDYLSKPKIVDGLLGEEVLDVGCGQDHIVVVTSDPIEPVFAWGTNKFGSLGVETSKVQKIYRPASVQIPLSTNEHGVKVACGTNVSGVLTNQGRLFVAGRFNGENNEDFLEVTPPSSVLRDVAFGENYHVFLDHEGHVSIQFSGRATKDIIDIQKVKILTHSTIKDTGMGVLGLGTSNEETFVIKIFDSQNKYEPIKICSKANCISSDETKLCVPTLISVSASQGRFCASYIMD